ncbi:MAG TPA: DUF493 domain-containing protein [Desulfobulbus sp.]|nr:DUF493 domain-containing protein [Desulfobulbus sp.]
MEKVPMQFPAGCRPEIDYPCVWQYKVIGTDRKALCEAIALHLGDAPYSVSDSRVSSGGRYISLNLEVTVYSDFNRLRLYEVLGEHPAVKVIL